MARTPEAVRRHAYRVGIPLYEYEICPQCGGRVDRLERDGVCYSCHLGELARGYRDKLDAIRAEVERSASDEERAKARREYNAYRSQASRLRRKKR